MIDARRKFITNKEAAKQLGCSETTIQKLMNTGQLYYIWVNGQRKITQELLEHFMESKTTTGPLAEDD